MEKRSNICHVSKSKLKFKLVVFNWELLLYWSITHQHQGHGLNSQGSHS